MRFSSLQRAARVFKHQQHNKSLYATNREPNKCVPNCVEVEKN